MDEIKRELAELKRKKGSIDYHDVDRITNSYNLSDEQTDELIIWIIQNDMNIELNPQQNLDDQYFSEISVYPLLSRQQEIELSHRIKDGDPIARDHFIKANLRLVVYVAGQYECQQLSKNDLIQEGNIGLLNAVDHYQIDMNVPFSHYAVFWIRKAILEAINKSQLIPIPRRIHEQIKKVNEVIEEYQQQNLSYPSNQQIGEKLGISASRVEQLMSYQLNIRSIDDTTLPDKDWINLIDDNSDDPFIQERVYELINSLPARDRKIMAHYFGLDNQPQLNLQQIAQNEGLTKQRVGQIIKSDIAYIRENYDK